MKSSEFHRKITRNGWEVLRSSGSHYIYTKDGVNISVPYHGSKEMGKGIQKAIEKQMGLK
jgi:mRNA interferase HicA